MKYLIKYIKKNDYFLVIAFLILLAVFIFYNYSNRVKNLNGEVNLLQLELLYLMKLELEFQIGLYMSFMLKTNFIMVDMI